jgi:hypothetical protein
MLHSADKELSIVEAARVIFRTAVPSDEQIQRVYKRMKAGTIPVRAYGGDPLKWTTTETALADFLAAQMIRGPSGASRVSAPREHAHAAPPANAGTSSRRARQAKRLRGVYYGMWRDYFLAVMLRRRMAHRSAAFRRAVLAGQVGLLALFAGVLAGAVRLAREPIVPEHVAIERWIDERTDRHQVVRWHPAQLARDGNGVTIEVEYRYAKDSARTITTRRTFRVAGEQVEEVSLE